MSDNETQLTIAPEDDGARLDRVLALRIPDLSRSRLKALILAGEVAIDGGTIRDPSERVKSGARVTVTVPEAEPAKPEAENIALNIVYEDDDLIVIDKPAGLVVHPAAGHHTGTPAFAMKWPCVTSKTPCTSSAATSHHNDDLNATSDTTANTPMTRDSIASVSTDPAMIANRP